MVEFLKVFRCGPDDAGYDMGIGLNWAKWVVGGCGFMWVVFNFPAL